MDLWGHIRGSAQVSHKHAFSIAALNGGSKAEICNFKSVISVEHEVFWFQISVRVSVLVHIIQAQEELLHVVARDILAKAAAMGDEVEKFSAAGEFENDVIDGFRIFL